MSYNVCNQSNLIKKRRKQMKIQLDLDTNEITLPKNYFKQIEKQNDLIAKMGGEKVNAMDLIKKSFEIAMSDTDKYVKTRV